jgi:hypothetical protein
MEILAFIHHSVTYDDPDPAQVTLQPIKGQIPYSVWIMMLGAATVLGVLGHSDRAIAQSTQPIAQSSESQGSQQDNSTSRSQLAIVTTRTGVGLNRRSTPNGPVLGSFPNGSSLTLTGRRQSAGDYTWAETTDGEWVATEFLREQPTATPASANSTDPEIATVSTPSRIGLNLRNAPNGEIIGGLPDGTTVTLTGTEQPAGQYIWTQTSQGWVAKNFLQLEGGTGGGVTTAAEPSDQEVAQASPASADELSSRPEAEAESDSTEVARANGESAVSTDEAITPDPAPSEAEVDRADLAPSDVFATSEPTQAEATPESDVVSASEPSPDADSFAVGVDPRSFRGPDGTFAIRQEIDQYQAPSGDIVGAIAPNETVTVTEQRSLADGKVWAQLNDGTWINATALDLSEDEP